MFLLINFFLDTTDVLEEFLIQERKREDKDISKKPKPPFGGLTNLGL